MLREEGEKAPSNRPGANVQSASMVKEERAQLVIHRLRGDP